MPRPRKHGWPLISLLAHLLSFPLTQGEFDELSEAEFKKAMQEQGAMGLAVVVSSGACCDDTP